MQIAQSRYRMGIASHTWQSKAVYGAKSLTYYVKPLSDAAYLADSTQQNRCTKQNDWFIIQNYCRTGMPSRLDQEKPLSFLAKSLIYDAKPLSERACLADLTKLNPWFT